MFVIPVIVYILLCVIIYLNRKKYVDAFANSWVILTLLIWMQTEILSFFQCWKTVPVLIFWIAAVLILLLILWKKGIENCLKEFIKSRNDLHAKWEKHKGFFIVTAATWVTLGIVALVRSQALVDNLCHRFVKIMHWMQNGTVEPFATDSSRQVQLSDLAEYMNAQILLLGGSDRIMNLIQIGAQICAGLLIYGICKKLKVSSRLAMVAAWLYWLIPAGIIEVCTTQTDIVAAVYLLTFLYYLLDFIQENKLRLDKNGVLAGARLAVCVMLGYLTKPTVCFAMVVFMLWMVIVRLMRRDKLYVLAGYVLVGGVVAGLLFMPSYLREKRAYTIENTVDTQVQKEMVEGKATDNDEPEGEQFQAVLDEETESKQAEVAQEANKAMVLHNLKNVNSFVLAGVQNLATNATSRCFPQVNLWLKRIVNKIDYEISYGLCRFQVFVDQADLGETSEPSPCIMWFTLIACILVVARISKLLREQLVFFWCSILSLIIQAGLMGYTYFRVRYLLGVMGTLCICFVLVIQNMRISDRRRRDVVVAMLAISSLGAINAMTFEINDAVEGLKGERIHQYFVNIDEVEEYYDEMISYVNEAGYTNVAILGDISYEYVVWQMVDNLQRLEAVNVEYAPMQKYEDFSYIPECIFAESKERIYLETQIECHGGMYECVQAHMNENSGMCYAVYVPTGEKL